MNHMQRITLPSINEAMSELDLIKVELMLMQTDLPVN
jgi:hypothetical protein